MAMLRIREREVPIPLAAPLQVWHVDSSDGAVTGPLQALAMILRCREAEYEVDGRDAYRGHEGDDASRLVDEHFADVGHECEFLVPGFGSDSVTIGGWVNGSQIFLTAEAADYAARGHTQG